MSFIFRAYHAMQRQRPMSTRTGVPTGATYVFVNMINKLRRDFAPEFFAAVFDVSAPVFRDERARAMTTIRKWNARTQSFDEVEYAGYKANREVMPADLAQQLPYIRRALEAFRIPILQVEGFEADDVIGTLARQASEQGYPVFIVSNDKDMMQLVNEHVKVLNPVKGNLVFDREKVIETLGVPPERVIDVMALRGDLIDNVPGAPGIGEKGSVDLIQQFGSVEAALDHASEVKRKTYRESLENNRQNILLSKELVTIDCAVPLPLDLDAMRTQPPDATACRALFTELEFTSLLKELAPAEEVEAVQYLTQPSPEQVEQFLRIARQQGFAVAFPLLETQTMQAGGSDTEGVNESEELPVAQNLSMLDIFEQPAADVPGLTPSSPMELYVGVSAEVGTALLLPLSALRSLLEDASIPKRVHDLKSALRRLSAQGIALCGAEDDVMLYSYLLNPTHSTHRLSDVTARFRNHALCEIGKNALPEAAHAILTLAPTLRREVVRENMLEVYEEIDRPLAPV